jgi:hypothetical protein
MNIFLNFQDGFFYSVHFVAVFALGSPELGLWWRQGSNCLDCHYQFFPPELNYLW